MPYFLLTYDCRRMHLDSVEEFPDAEPDAAFDAFCDRERPHQSDPRVWVMLMQANRIEDLHVTHGNFFQPAPTEPPF